MPAVPTALWVQRRPRMLAMREAGKTLAEIATYFGCTKGQVSGQIHTLKRADVIAEPVKAGAEAPNARVEWTNEMDTTLRFMRQQRWSFEAVAGELRLAPATVRKRAAELGMAMELPPVEKPQAPPKIEREVFWNQERHAALIEMSKKGMSGPEIAKEMGVSKSAISGQMAVLKGKGLIDAAAIKAANLRCAETRERLRAKQRVVRAPKVEVKIDKPARPQVEHLVGYDKIVAAFNSPACAGVSIFDLRSSFITQCRWPFTCDDGETRYCGAKATDGSWCAEHGARVFQSASRPKAEPRVSGRSMFMQGARA